MATGGARAQQSQATRPASAIAQGLRAPSASVCGMRSQAGTLAAPSRGELRTACVRELRPMLERQKRPGEAHVRAAYPREGSTTLRILRLDLRRERSPLLRPDACAGLVRVAAQQTTQEKPDADSAARQMLGMKGAALETDKFKIRVQLTKPVTWIPLIWGKAARQAALRRSRAGEGAECEEDVQRSSACTHVRAGVACGAAASGNYVWNNPTQIAQLLTCMMMSGPFLTGYTQVRRALVLLCTRSVRTRRQDTA